jgi:HD-like signal output (HDOD) protein
MSAFRESVKSAFAQVFGRADIESVLKDGWDYDKDFPQEKRDAMKPRPQEKPEPIPERKPMAATKPMAQRRKRKPSPVPRLAPLPPKPVNLAHIPESILPPQPAPVIEAAPVVAGRLVTEGAPHAGSAEGARTTEEEFGALLDGASESMFDEEDAPPNRETLEITGSHAPCETPGAEELQAAMRSDIRPALRLGVAPASAPAIAPVLLTRPKDVISGSLDIPEPLRLDPDEFLRVDSSYESTSLDGMPLERLADGGALPPASIWDEEAIRGELLDDLSAQLAVAEEPAERRVLQALRESLLKEELDFPPFPPGAGKLVGNGGAGPSDEDLLDIIRTDVGLAGKLMKVANSPFYLAASPVASINAAVVRIGLDQVRRITIAASISESYKVKGYESVMAHLRLHSVGTAMAAELLAINSPVNPAEAFLAGLLHDVGEALVYRLVRKTAQKDCAAGDDWYPDRRVLRRLARRHHLRLGALFLGTWDLAANVASAIAYHHHPEQAEPRFLDIAALIHIADQVALRAVQHVQSQPWKSHLALRALANGPAAVSEAVEADGVNDVMVSDLLGYCPRGWDEERLRGVLRSVALRLDGNDLVAVDGSATLASMTL